jgi:hypothetical protein
LLIQAVFPVKVPAIAGKLPELFVRAGNAFFIPLESRRFTVVFTANSRHSRENAVIIIFLQYYSRQIPGIAVKTP